ncbi:hypothetical protein ACH46N_34770 [Streptomyces pristinaespiralis]|uniref:hypothetical protein n=1 Tax=Streptomyces pristinaespiralis TaxID=38300 RepID=UPI00131A0496|nr:hypothetical protein [Streptomyces pristinaespiralis]QMU18841.1 hypothetical protein H3L99_35075 [Streptomyces pristinaespiralis]
MRQTEAVVRLRRHTAAPAEEPLDVFCDELLIGPGTDSADDIALLVARPVPPS